MNDIHKAAGIIIKDKKLLFTRAQDRDFFVDPGGKIEPGETAKQALVRELKEELSIDVDENDLEFYGEFSGEAMGRPGVQVNMQVFIVKRWRGEIIPSSEIEELQWFGANLPSDIKVGSVFGGMVLPKLVAAGLVE